ncbi:phosphate ABC transporter substrate-binding protein PstS [Bowdeniella nasicola]|uniref:Phosphate-binding protein n=1 Tax=Bowdeniella nasicola TaxID=208480 RepID=A0A1Q5Q3B4_9ACTO|nr:phosphate ABC transporter substrate-binding protein PstS [Bowdeniella nasicola]OKL54265.1 phosphate ABC transporter substrate-binding protein PstS [Bowdeniella nasicola]
MRHGNRRFTAITAASFLALSLAACGSDEAVKSPSSDAKTDSDAKTSESSGAAISGSIAGAGASSQESAMKAWVAEFQGKNSGATIAYDPVGSGAGIEQFIGEKVQWAGSDAALEGDEVAAAEKRCGAPALNLPMYISPVAVIFNLEGVKDLNLKAETIAKIFSGDITKWNDPAIAADNPDVQLPDLAITPVHRADKSGTTENFTDYLHAAAPEAWPHEPDKSWPISGGESGDKTAGLVDVVNRSQGAIGYADASQAGSLGTVALETAEGFVKFSAKTAAAAVDKAKPAEGASDTNLPLVLDRKPESKEAYPLVLVTYEIACSTYKNADEGNLVKAFLKYVASDEGQKAAANAAGSAPLSAEMSAKVTAAIDSIKAG